MTHIGTGIESTTAKSAEEIKGPPGSVVLKDSQNITLKDSQATIVRSAR